MRAEAAAANDRVALDQQLIAMLPEVIRGTSDGLAKANITVLNGAEGYNQTVSGLVGQSMAVLESLRAGIRSPAVEHDTTANGAVPSEALAP